MAQAIGKRAERRIVSIGKKQRFMRGVGIMMRRGSFDLEPEE